MKYADLINFNPIESIIQLTAANDKKEAISLVKSYVMSDDMADKLNNNMLSQLRLEDVVDNKGGGGGGNPTALLYHAQKN